MSPGARHYGWAGQGVKKGNWQQRVKRRRGGDKRRGDKSGRRVQSLKGQKDGESVAL